MRWTAHGGTKSPLRIAQGDEGHGLDVIWDAQERLDLIFTTQVSRGEPRPQAEGAGCQEEVLHRQPDRRGVAAPDNRLSRRVGSRAQGVVSSDQDHGRHFGHVVGQVAR